MIDPACTALDAVKAKASKLAGAMEHHTDWGRMKASRLIARLAVQRLSVPLESDVGLDAHAGDKGPGAMIALELTLILAGLEYGVLEDEDITKHIFVEDSPYMADEPITAGEFLTAICCLGCDAAPGLLWDLTVAIDTLPGGKLATVLPRLNTAGSPGNSATTGDLS